MGKRSRRKGGSEPRLKAVPDRPADDARERRAAGARRRGRRRPTPPLQTPGLSARIQAAPTSRTGARSPPPPTGRWSSTSLPLDAGPVAPPTPDDWERDRDQPSSGFVEGVYEELGRDDRGRRRGRARARRASVRSPRRPRSRRRGARLRAGRSSSSAWPSYAASSSAPRRRDEAQAAGQRARGDKEALLTRAERAESARAATANPARRGGRQRGCCAPAAARGRPPGRGRQRCWPLSRATRRRRPPGHRARRGRGALAREAPSVRRLSAPLGQAAEEDDGRARGAAVLQSRRPRAPRPRTPSTCASRLARSRPRGARRSAVRA